MDIVGLSIVRNESDIIESLVRHNLGVLDRLIVIDNASSDGTRDILAALRAEGLALDLHDADHLDHRQADTMTQLLRELERQPAIGHAVLLDADEFIAAPDRETFRHAVGRRGPDTLWLLPMATYVPTAADDWSEPDPLRRIVHRRTAESANPY